MSAPLTALGPSLLPPRSRADSSFHRVATLYCPHCLYLEFPGCLIHNGLLCHQKGNGYMSCQGCENDRKASGGESNDSVLSGICATDLSEPWSIACQHCNTVKADTVPWIIDDSQSVSLAKAMDREVLDVVPHLAIQCTQCKTSVFPIAHGHLTRNDSGSIRGRINDTSTEDQTRVYDIAEFPFAHYATDCQGSLSLIPILISKLEGKFCGQSLPSTPSLPKNELLMPGFIPPLSWVTGAVMEAQREEAKVRNGSYLLSHLQEKEWKAPVWRDRSYVGEFGDVFVRDTELEGGLLAPSIASLELVTRRLLTLRRQSWLKSLNDIDIANLTRVIDAFKHGTTIAMTTKDSVMALNDPEVDRATRDQKFLAVLMEWHATLRALQPGQFLILPGGWIAPKGGHGIMHCIFCNIDGTYSFTVSNTGGGLQNHPSTDRDSPKTKFQCTMRFNNIPPYKMLDDGFWFLFWRLQLISSDDHDHRVIYDILIPHLIDSTVGVAITNTHNADDRAAEWRTPQRAGNCYYKSVLECFRYLCRTAGLSKPQVKSLMFAVRREYCEMIVEDLECLSSFPSQFAEQTPLHDESDLPMIRLGTKQLCYTAIKESNSGRLSAEDLEEIYGLVDRIERTISSMGFEVNYDTKTIPQIKFNGRLSNEDARVVSGGNDSGESRQSQSLPSLPALSFSFPGFECFQRHADSDNDWEAKLAGTYIQLTPALTVNYNVLPSQPVTQLDQCLSLIDTALTVCSATGNNDSLNDYYHRIAFIHTLVLSSLPAPMTRELEHQDVWLSRPLLLVEQQRIIHSLLRLARNYLAAVFSIDFPANFPASHRVLTMATLVAIADRVLRINVSDVEDGNPVTKVYNGSVAGSEGYGPNLSNGSDQSLASFTAQQECVEPQLALTRGKILEYFSDTEKRVKHKLFTFANSGLHRTTQHASEDTALEFVRQVCHAAGYIIDRRGYGNKELSESEAVAKFLYTDEEGLYGISHARQLPVLAKEHPELGHFRDLMFLYKLSLNPMRSNCRTVSLARWREQDARVFWNYQAVPMANGLVFVFAKAFDRKDILAIQTRAIKSPANPATHLTTTTTNQSSTGPMGLFGLGGMGGLAGLLGGPQQAPESKNADGINESDIIHSQSLPLFNGLLTVESSEKLLSTLTVPYLRIPLLLAFFASPDRVSLLQDRAMQRILETAVFEPANWSVRGDTAPLSSVPAIAGRLGSCYGILFNELAHSPSSLFDPLLRLIQYGLSLDTGSIQSANASLVLFLSKFVSRIEYFTREAQYLVRIGELQCSEMNQSALRAYHSELLLSIHHQLLPALMQYRAEAATDIPRATLLHSHIALVAASLVQAANDHNSDTDSDSDSELNALCVFLGSFAFVSTWHTMGVGIGKRLEDESEMSDEADANTDTTGSVLSLTDFASSLSSSMERSKNKKAQRDALIEVTINAKPAVPEMELFAAIQRVRPVILKFLARANNDSAINALLDSVVRCVHSQDFHSPRSQSSHAHSWRALDENRYVNSDSTVEVNLQSGGLFSHNSHIFPVTDRIARSAEYQSVFGSEPRHYSVTGRYEAKSDFAMFGSPFSLSYWAQPEKYEELIGLPVPVPRTLGTEIEDANYRYHTAVTTGGQWKCSGKDCKHENDGHAEKCTRCGAFKPMMSEVEKRGVLYQGTTYTRRYGSTRMVDSESWLVELMEQILYENYGDKRESFNFSLFAPTAVTDTDADSVSLIGLDGETWKQVVCHRSSMLVHVYAFRCHGRHTYRSLIYTSNARRSLRSLAPGTRDRPKPWQSHCRFQAGNIDEMNERRESLIITHTVNGTDRQYAPPVVLYGLVPESLLERFHLWQVLGDGDQNCLIGLPRSQSLQPTGSTVPDYGLKVEMKLVDSQWEATVTQASLTDDGDDIEEEKGCSGLRLVNLLRDSSDGTLSRMTAVLTRIEDISHILVWARDDIIDRVELPRLQLSFVSRYDSETDSHRMHSLDHSGFWITDYNDSTLTVLLAPLPFSLLLENDRHELRVLAVNCPIHRPRVASCPFHTELVADRVNTDWLKTVKTRYYVYTVHVSHTFLLAETLASTLFLLMLELMARNYDRAYRMAETCELDAGLSREERWMLGMMERTLHDQHPNAHAVRLKLAITVSASESKLPWTDDLGHDYDLSAEYASYIKKLSHISAACRLSVDDEKQLIELCKDSKGEIEERFVENRAMVLEHVPSSDTTTFKTVTVPFRNGKREGFKNAWFEFEASVSQFFGQGWQPGVWHGTLCYSRPSASQLTGVSLSETVGDCLNDTSVGAQHKLGFFFLYDLLTGACQTRISTSHTDCSFTLGKLLTIMAYCKLTKYGEKLNPGSHMLPFAVNAVIAARYFPTPNNPQRQAISIPADRFPPLPRIPLPEYQAQLERGCVLNRSNNPVGASLQTIGNYFSGFLQICREWHTSRPVIGSVPPNESPATVRVSGWELCKPTDTACNDRILNPFKAFPGCELLRAEFESLTVAPLASVIDSETLEERRNNDSEAGLTSLPFSLSHHPTAQSFVAKSMLARLTSDIDDYRQQQEQSERQDLKGVATEDWKQVSAIVQRIRAALRALRAIDSEAVRSGQQLLSLLANYVPNTPIIGNDSDAEWHDRLIEFEAQSATAADETRRYRFVMSRYSGESLTVGQEYMAAALLSTSAERNIEAMNPYLPAPLIGSLLSFTSVLLLRTNRLGLIDRAIAECGEAMRLIGRIQSLEKDVSADTRSELKLSLVIQSRAIVDGLTVKRAYTRPIASFVAPSPQRFDPRFLVFEFIFNIMLRKQQVELVQSFVDAASDGRSEVQQMIMGAGKTTVVGPLLTLILADGQRLVTQVVPAALLPMSRAVLRSRFTALLPKRILTLSFDRATTIEPRMLARLLTKLDSARHSKGAVVASAVSVKSLFLKYVELLDELQHADTSAMSVLDERSLQAKSDCADILSRILTLFQHGVLLMDEVDLLLHPLRSELNFPIGARLPLQPSPDRFLLAMHVLDAINYRQSQHLTVTAMRDILEARESLSVITRVIEAGRERRALQTMPHLVLLNEEFYHRELKPVLAQWTALFLRAKGIGTGTVFSEAACVAVLCHGWLSQTDAPMLAASLSPSQMSLVNLSHSWLSSYLPHCLQKVDRVSFGLLTAEDLLSMSSLTDSAVIPQTRRLVSVPFLAKDVPSRSSEFAHPDVLIGLTVLAYRIEGLRRSDVMQIVIALKKSATEEMGPQQYRPSSVLFEQFISEARSLESNCTVARVKILPLAQFSTSDSAQLDSLFRLTHRLPSMIAHYLVSYVFPTCLLSQSFNLSASGQELGGSMLFGTRLGFSGTPSSLLPLELGQCGYERGADGQVLNLLSSANIVSAIVKHDWSVLGILDDIAKASNDATTKSFALIDAGALITGYENQQVAEILLDRGLDADGVVYFNRNDEAMILLRATRASIPLSQSGIALHRRFSFYDQIHSTGIDLKHPPTAQAVLTLGKDMTFRDYSQAAYRMRQIGKGQRVQLIVIDEVAALMARTLRIDESALTNREALPLHVCAWLTTNSMRAERLQFYQLCQQNIANVARKQAFKLMKADTDVAYDRQPTVVSRSDRHRRYQSPSAERLRFALNLFREPVNFSVANEIPRRSSFFDSLKSLVASRAGWIEEAWQCVDIGTVLTQALETSFDTSTNTSNDSDASFDREMVSEQQREKEAEREQEILREPRAARGDESLQVWKIDQLSSTPSFVSHDAASHFLNTIKSHPFYALGSLRIAECPQHRVQFPSSLLVSHNFYKQGWAINPTQHRRVKNVSIVLEWTCTTDTGSSRFTDSDREQRTAALFELCAGAGESELRGSAAAQAARVLGLSSTDNIEGIDQLQFSALINGTTSVTDVARHWVIVPLVEAETLRRSIHTLQPIFARGINIALWTLDGQLIDYTANFDTRPATDRDIVFQSIRFFNNEFWYNTSQLRSLLRGLGSTPLASRKRFFSRLLECRHRERRDFSRTPVNEAVKFVDELDWLRTESLWSRLCQALHGQRKLSALQSFAAIDSNNDGYIDSHELYSALVFAGLTSVSGRELDSVMRVADRDNDSKLDFNEFSMRFHHSLHGNESPVISRRSSVTKLMRQGTGEIVFVVDDDGQRQLHQQHESLSNEARSTAEIPVIPQVPLPADFSAGERTGDDTLPTFYDTPSDASTSTSAATTSQQAPPAADAGGWSCSTCTFINTASLTRCSVCNQLRAPAAAFNPMISLFGAAQPQREWTCAVCTLLNPGQATACQACGSNRS